MIPIIAFPSRITYDRYREAIDYARAQGYRGIDWNLDFFRIPVNPARREAIFKIFLDSGLVHRFHAPCADIELAYKNSELSRMFLSYLKMYVDFLQVIPHTQMTVHIGSRSIASEELSWEVMISNLRELARYGKERGLTICLENLKRSWSSDPYKLLEIAELADLKLTFDVGHANASTWVQSGRGTVIDFLRVISKRVVSAHLYELETPQGRHLPPQDLTLLGSVLEELLKLDCDWWLLELTNYQDLLRTYKIVREYYEAVLEKEVATRGQKEAKNFN